MATAKTAGGNNVNVCMSCFTTIGVGQRKVVRSEGVFCGDCDEENLIVSWVREKMTKILVFLWQKEVEIPLDAIKKLREAKRLHVVKKAVEEIFSKIKEAKDYLEKLSPAKLFEDFLIEAKKVAKELMIEFKITMPSASPPLMTPFDSLKGVRPCRAHTTGE